MEDVNIVVTSSGLVEEALSDEYLEKLNEEAHAKTLELNFNNYESI